MPTTSHGPYAVARSEVATGIGVKTGDHIRTYTSVADRITFADSPGSAGPRLNADGRPNSPAPANYPAPQRRVNSLVCRVTPHASWYQGGTETAFRVKEPGSLRLAVNDPTPAYNVGSWQVTVYHTPAGETPRPVRPSDVFFHPSGHDWSGKEPRSLVAREVEIAGWLIGSGQNRAGNHEKGFDLWAEDWLWDLVLDVDFIEARYGSDGLSGRFRNAVLPGNPSEEARPPLPRLYDMSPDGQPRGITPNSFSIPHGNGGGREPGIDDRLTLHIELNCWHERKTNTGRAYNWQGRGPHPWRWITYDEQPPEAPWDERERAWRWKYFDDEIKKEIQVYWAKSWWPYHPRDPDGRGALRGAEDPNARKGARRSGDYVIMRGALWQDADHPMDVPTRTLYPGHGGWLELHPPDVIRRPDDWRARTTGPRKTTGCVGIAHPATPAGPAEYARRVEIWPDFDPSPGKVLRVDNVRELIDGRFTDLQSVASKRIRDLGEFAEIQVRATSDHRRAARFKATYIVTWKEVAPEPIFDCAPLHGEISVRRGELQTLREQLDDLDPKDPDYREKLRELNLAIQAERRAIDGLTARGIREGCLYKVGHSETLRSIAALFGMSWQRLHKLNENITPDPDKPLPVGLVLKVRESNEVPR